jgi:hypothetical protein
MLSVGYLQFKSRQSAISFEYIYMHVFSGLFDNEKINEFWLHLYLQSILNFFIRYL